MSKITVAGDMEGTALNSGDFRKTRDNRARLPPSSYGRSRCASVAPEVPDTGCACRDIHHTGSRNPRPSRGSTHEFGKKADSILPRGTRCNFPQPGSQA